jgi:diguanylate cyclase (GGDEF)-like protein
VLLDDRGGRRLVGAEHWDAALRDALLEHGTGDQLWRDAVASGDVAVESGDEIPADLRAVAADAGYSTFAVAPVADPGGGSAALVAWFDQRDAASMEFVHGSGELRELLSLALERQHHLTRLDHAARHDELTGLLNRSGFVELVTELGDELPASDAGDKSAALLYLDLDGFKPVNDRYGHAVGDAVLRVVAGRLSALTTSASAGPGALPWAVARIGGDEFVMLGHGGAALADGATSLAEAAVAAISEPIEVAGADGDLVGVQIGASVGVALTGADGAVHELLELADGAMYRVKAEGGHAWSARLPD